MATGTTTTGTAYGGLDPGSIAARATAGAAPVQHRVAPPAAADAGGTAPSQIRAGRVPGCAARPATNSSDASCPLGIARLGAGAARTGGGAWTEERRDGCDGWWSRCSR
jgi:hypothetical protein